MRQEKSDLLTRFQQHIRREGLFSAGDKLFLAVSGGLDSMVLSDLCHRSGFDLVILHANFQLRGEESGRDQEFVEAIAHKYSVLVVAKRFDTVAYAQEKKLSIQDAARKLRYDWFQNFLNDEQGNRCLQKHIVTAHHADDNLETLLMNFFRGTGIHGLRGMKPYSDLAVHPLLFTRRQELEAYAKQQGLAWVEDSSNQENKYTRNAIRHDILPAVEKVFPGAADHLVANLDRFREIEALYSRSIKRELKRLLIPSGEEWRVPVELLRRSEPLHTLVWEIFSRYGFTAHQVPDIIHLMDSDTGHILNSNTHRLLKDRNWFIISALHSTEKGIYLLERGMKELIFPPGKLNLNFDVEVQGVAILPDPHLACLDARDLIFPILVRPWKPGDYFYPLGMRKKKKISRFLIDLKMSRNDKEKVWVVESGKKIIWVIGLRIDDRFRITEGTRSQLQLRFKPA